MTGNRSDVIERDGKFYAFDGDRYVDMNTVPQEFTSTIVMTSLPTSDPSVVGQLWSNSGVLTVSAG